ncbi:MAG: hypothetical protein EPN99_02815 [Frankiales bacterium]|nr:MAG: hypothetical protein EPN99_02815 [Frankiales bacterium]
MRAPTTTELRRGVLAVSVLNDVDLEPARAGVMLTGSPRVWVSWSECRRALAGHDPEGTLGRARLSAWLLARRWCADLSREELELALRPVGLPLEHVLHPGLDWVRERVLGEALDLGFGAVGVDPADPDRVVLVPTSALDEAGIDPEVAWSGARLLLEELGSLAAERVARDPKGQLRPYGGCDVVTLLGSRSLRTSLANAAGGMGAAVVPMRRRGWTRLALIDPAFGPAAAAATPAQDRGFDRPVLLTSDELTLAAEGGRPERLALRDRPAETWVRDVLYH